MSTHTHTLSLSLSQSLSLSFSLSHTHTYHGQVSKRVTEKKSTLSKKHKRKKMGLFKDTQASESETDEETPSIVNKEKEDALYDNGQIKHGTAETKGGDKYVGDFNEEGEI